MARYGSNRSRRSVGSSSRSRRKSSTSSSASVKKLAYQMGQIQAGLKNANSQVSASYKAGQNSVQFKNKKPLF